MGSEAMPHPGWAADPYQRHQLRYFDGQRWTEHVSDNGTATIDAPPTAATVSPIVEAPARVLTRLKKTKYLGSHPRVSGQAQELDVVFTTSGIVFRAGRSTLGERPWSAVVELTADTNEGLEKRLTGPRLLLLGGLAFIAKKETRIAYLIIRDAEGDWIFAVPGLSAIELRSGLVGLQKFVAPRPSPATQTPAVAATATPAERLQRLADLKADGLITDAEHADRRQAILDTL